MKKIIITISLLAILLLILTPSIPAIQCATLVETNTTQRIQPIQSIGKNELKAKRSGIDFLNLKHILKNILTSEEVQKIKKLFNNHFQNAIDKFLRVLLLWALIAYSITYVIGKSLGSSIDILLYLLTQGKWELLYTTSIALIPSEFFFWIMIAIYEIGMKICDWPFPDYPGGH